MIIDKHNSEIGTKTFLVSFHTHMYLNRCNATSKDIKLNKHTLPYFQIDFRYSSISMTLLTTYYTYNIYTLRKKSLKRTLREKERNHIKSIRNKII